MHRIDRLLQFNPNFPLSDTDLARNRSVQPIAFRSHESATEHAPGETTRYRSPEGVALQADYLYLSDAFRFRTSGALLVLEQFTDPTWTVRDSWG